MATSFRFSDIQQYLDAILAKSKKVPVTHGVFWRNTGNYHDDYVFFTTSGVPNVDIPIMNQQAPLQSNFYLILQRPLQDEGIPQMPVGGPYITSPDYVVTVGSVSLTGDQIKNNIADWLSNGFPA